MRYLVALLLLAGVAHGAVPTLNYQTVDLSMVPTNTLRSNLLNSTSIQFEKGPRGRLTPFIPPTAKVTNASLAINPVAGSTNLSLSIANTAGVPISGFTSNGFFGIGTTTPQRALHVIGNGVIFERSNATPQMVLRNPGPLAQDWNFNVDSAGDFVLRDATGLSADILRLSPNAADYSLWVATNQVYIGTNLYVLGGATYIGTVTAAVVRAANFTGDYQGNGAGLTNVLSANTNLLSASNALALATATASSNNVRVAAGANVTVTPSVAAGVMTYTVASTAAGGGGGDVTYSELSSFSNSQRTAYIAADVAISATSSNALRTAYLTEVTAASNILATALALADNSSSNALLSALYASSNVVATAGLVNAGTSSNALRTDYLTKDFAMSNTLATASSNNVQITAGANVTVTPSSPGAGVMSYAIASTGGGGGGGGFTFPGVTQLAYAANVFTEFNTTNAVNWFTNVMTGALNLLVTNLGPGRYVTVYITGGAAVNYGFTASYAPGIVAVWLTPTNSTVRSNKWTAISFQAVSTNLVFVASKEQP